MQKYTIPVLNPNASSLQVLKLNMSIYLHGTSLVAQWVKNLLAMWDTQVPSHAELRHHLWFSFTHFSYPINPHALLISSPIFLFNLSTSVHFQFSRSVVSDSLQPHGLQHTRFPCSSPTPGACSNSCPPSQWCHPTISSSVVSSSHL